VGEIIEAGRSRRALLAGAAGAVAAVAVEALARPAPVVAESAMMTNVVNHGLNQTSIDSPQTTDSSAVFAAYGTDATHRVYALFGETASSNGFGVYGYSGVDGVGVEGHSVVSTGVIGVSGTNEYSPIDGHGVIGRGKYVGVRGTGGSTGVQGETSEGNGFGVAGHALGLNGTGTIGFAYATGGVGVLGQANAGTGVVAASSGGTALKVSGKARFDRSGRASVLKNKSSVDVDLTSRGGINSTALCFANLAYPRTGVYVRAVRPNYPSTGRMRIYLNKVASTTASTPLSWLVLESS
jgi:hypothetical protein